MFPLWRTALTAINGYVQEITNKKSEVYLALFDTQGYEIIRDCKVSEWKDLTSEEATPRGGTPLYDAMGTLIQTVKAEKNEKSLIVVMTDGYENASKEFNLQSIKAQLVELEAAGWPVVFLGANFDKVEAVGQTFGINSSNTVNITPSNLGATFRDLGARTSRFYASAAGSVAATSSMLYTAEQKAAAVAPAKVEINHTTINVSK